MKDCDFIITSLNNLINGQEPEINIAPLLFHHHCFYLLTKLNVPSEYTKQIHIGNFLNQLNIAERFKQCNSVFSDLEAYQIDYAVIKGAVLSLAAYGNPYCRQSGDMDILIDRAKIDAVGQIMNRNGFIQGRVIGDKIVPYTRKERIFQLSMSHQTAPFVKAIGNPFCPYINVDVNMDIMWGESKAKTDMKSFLSHSNEISLCGTTFRRLSPAAEFISLCLHHYKDFNSIYLLATRGISLNHLCDILFYLKTSAPPLPELLEMSKAYRATDYIYCCLYYVSLVFHDSVLMDYLEAFRICKTTDLTPYYGLDDRERKEWNISFADRLFNEDFPKKFYDGLSPQDKEKVKNNQAYM